MVCISASLLLSLFTPYSHWSGASELAVAHRRESYINKNLYGASPNGMEAPSVPWTRTPLNRFPHGCLGLSMHGIL